MSLKSINPATAALIREYTEISSREVSERIEKTHQAFLQWRSSQFELRATLLKKAASILRQRSAEYGRLMTDEMGKPLKDGRAEAEKCAWVCDYYAENAEKFLQQQAIESDASTSYVSFQPLGVILAVMPWNFPFWQVFRFAAPCVMAGNGALLKHASNVSGCSLAIEQVFSQAGFPENLFSSLLISSRNVQQVIEHPRVMAVTLTGSVAAGKAVAGKAGEQIKKTVLELGGSDPYVVLDDADLDKTVKACVTSRLINSGQSCIAAKRFIVTEKNAEQFIHQFTEQMRAKKMGDPLHEDTDVGPQAQVALRDELHQQVQQSIKMGARCLLGGEIPQGKGAFYPATVLTDVKPGMPAFDEEMFGPVAAIITVADEQQAVEMANKSVFGLGAAVFTKDVEKGEQIAATQLQAGCCFVNSFVKSDPRLPFGGIKQSGYGRELSRFGIQEFVNIKTVYVS